MNKHKIISAIPFFMLFLTALSSYCSIYDYYEYVFKYLGDSVGYSLLTNIVFAFLYFRKSFCIQTKIAVSGLAIMNIISLVFISGGWTYSKVYDLWIILIISLIALITFFK